MANTTITALTNLASESIADEDVFVVDDITANETKKITFANLAAAIDTTQLANVLILQGNVVQLTANIDLVQDNVSALPDSAANDFITYTRLNANINVVQDNVAVIPSSFANAHYITTTTNSYNIGVTVASINEVDVYVGGVYQNKKEYILANSSHNVQFRDATFVAGEDIEIISRT